MKGYYSLIQYCPCPSRDERVNLGVILLCPEAGFADAMTNEDYTRARRLFFPDGSWKEDAYITSALQALETRIRHPEYGVESVADLRRVVATHTGRIRVTEPRPMRVEDPETELKELFEELVL